MADGPAWRRDSTSHHHETLLNPKLYQSEQQRCSASLMSVMRAANLCPSSDTRQEDHPELSVLPVFRTLRPSGRVPAAGSEPRDKPGVVKKDFLQRARQLSSGFLEAQKMEFQCALRPREQFGLDTHAATETISPIDQE
jgi:hypothetical protein